MNKIALDIHGVIDQEPEFFSWLSRRLKLKEWEIHILTGGRYVHNEKLLKEWNIHYDHFFSITDYHLNLGTPMLPGTCDGEVCVTDELWDCVKGEYCGENNIILSLMIHIDIDNICQMEQSLFFGRSHPWLL